MPYVSPLQILDSHLLRKSHNEGQGRNPFIRGALEDRDLCGIGPLGDWWAAVTLPWFYGCMSEIGLRLVGTF